MRTRIIYVAVGVIGLINVAAAEIGSERQVYDPYNAAQLDTATMDYAYDVAASGIASDNELLIQDILGRLLPPDASESTSYQFEANLRLADTATLEEISWASTFEEAASILLPGSLEAKALADSGGITPLAIGSLTQDYVYTAVNPCRITDSRPEYGGPGAPGTQSAGDIRSFFVWGSGTTMAAQGGNPAGCPSPRGEPRGVHINVTVVGKAPGHLTIVPSGTPIPTASFLNYTDGTVVANAGNIRTMFSSLSPEIDVYAEGDTEVIIDVLGYFHEVDALAPSLAQSIADPLGDLLFGGDGGDGPLDIAVNTNWNLTGFLDRAARQYSTCTVRPGVTLTVPAGTTIRCSGNVIIDGTISVLSGAQGGAATLSRVDGPNLRPAHPGDTPGSAGFGERHDRNEFFISTIREGAGGRRIQTNQILSSFNRLAIGGGAGAGRAGGDGGGLLKIYANGTITVIGTINADALPVAAPASGGGGGGIVILASRSRVILGSGTGTRISVRGSNGFAADPFGAGGGGGGGGIVVLASPSAPSYLASSINIAGGIGGGGLSILQAQQSGGGGGGGSGGQGGKGGNVICPNSLSLCTLGPGSNGAPGYVIALTADPIIHALQ